MLLQNSINKLTLSNKLDVYLIQENTNPILSLQLYVKLGSVDENDRTSGYSHFIEHLVFNNTIKYPDNQLTLRANDIGAILNAYTDFNLTCFNILIPCENYCDALELLSEVVFRPHFRDNDILKEKAIILEEIKQYENDPDASFIDWIQDNYFVNNPLKKPILGSKDSIQNASLESLLEFYKAYYKTDNAFLVVAGKYSLENLIVSINYHFANLTYVNYTKTKVPDSISEESRFRFFVKTMRHKTSYLAFVLPELPENSKDCKALSLALKIFASGPNSRLYKRLVEDEKISLDISLHSIVGFMSGITIIQVVPTKEKYVNDIIYVFYDELIKIRQSLLPEETNSAKRELVFSWLFDFEHIDTLSTIVANSILYDTYDDFAKYPDDILKTKLETIENSINMYWIFNHLSIFYCGKSIFHKDILDNIDKLFKGENDSSKNNNFTILDKRDNIDDAPMRLNQYTHSNQPDFKQLELQCGMNLLLKKVEKRPVIGLAMTTSISQLSEPFSLYGINFLTSNLLLFGSQAKTFKQIQQICLENGLGIKVSNNIDTTTIKGKCLNIYLSDLLNLVADIIQNPSFPPRYNRYIKDVITESNRNDQDDPFTSAYNKWINIFLGKNNNLHKPYLSITSLERIQLNDIRNWFNYYYGLHNFTLSVTGDFDFNEIEDLCNKLFVCKKDIKQPVQNIAKYESKKSLTYHRKSKSDQSNIIIGGWGCPGLDIESTISLQIISYVLGGDLSSRFYSILREKHGFAYQTGFDFTSIQCLSYWYGYAICNRKDSQTTLSIMKEIILDISTHGISETELKRAKTMLKSNNRFEMESVSNHASTLSILYTLGYDHGSFCSMENMIDKISLAKVSDTSSKLLDSNNLFIYFEK